MARPLRIERAGAWYHITGRGTERRVIYKDDRDRRRFLDLLAEAVDLFNLGVHGYVLMGNHYHLIAETREANLSRAMQWLQTSQGGSEFVEKIRRVARGSHREQPQRRRLNSRRSWKEVGLRGEVGVNAGSARKLGARVGVVFGASEVRAAAGGTGIGCGRSRLRGCERGDQTI
jgi:putative transposase